MYLAYILRFCIKRLQMFPLLFVLIFCIFVSEKYHKPTTVQRYRADCVSWVRPTANSAGPMNKSD